MLDSELQILLRSTILTGLNIYSLPDVGVKTSHQPRQVAVPTAATVYIYHFSTVRYGSPSRSEVWDSVAQVMNYTTKQLMETTYQIAGLSPQSPATPEAMTTDDLVRIVANILQHQTSLDTLNAAGVGILRIQDIGILWFENEKNQNEANPSFKIVLRHNDTFTTPVDVISTFTAGITPI